MARKLTEEERETVEALRGILNDALPPNQRGIASGIASALVRIPATTVTEDDLGRILGKYEEADEALAQTVRDTLLDAVEGQEGVYTLRVPPVAESDAPEEDAGAGAGEEPDGADTGASASEGKTADGDAPVEEDAADVTASEAGPAEEPGTSAPDGEPAEDAPVAEEGEPQGDDAPSEPAPEQEDPAPKPRRSRRGGRRTHKTAKSTRDAKTEEASKAEEPAQPGSGSPAGKDSPNGGERGNKAGKSSSDKDDKADTPSADKAEKAPTGKAEKATKLDKGHHRDSSRDLKKVPYVRRGGDTEAETRQKILNLDQRFWLNGWLLSHPAAYTLYERELLAINDALKDGMLPGDITRRQLAYQMGGDEKFFEYGNDGFRLLRAMGMEDVIRHRPMPKPDLVYYAPRRRKHMRVLVTENLDPYLDVHDLMYEDGRTSILGQRIHAVVLGGGTPILEKNRLALLLDTLGADTVTVLYWGDIDRAGLEIMVKLKEVLGDGYKFRAFTPAYQLMVDKASERFPDPADNESTGQVNIEPMDASLLVDGLTDEAATYARAVIDDCGLIPQEILTRRDL